MKILVVDDREEDRYLLEKMLGGEGFDVVSAADGKEALEAARKEEPNMVISDILMPEMDGYQLLREFKSDKKLRRIPFVFYTATYTSKEDEDFAKGLGVSRFIRKPEEPKHFIEKVKEVIREHDEGLLPAGEPSIKHEEAYLREYNERLVRKLEDKVAELSAAKKEVERARDFLQALLESMKDGILFIDREGQVTLTNRAGRDMEKEVLKKILPLLEKAEEECLCDMDLEVGGRYYDVCCCPVTVKGGGYMGTTIVLRDITERKRAKEELKDRIEELERWQRLTVGREVRMIELKKQIKELEAEVKKLKERG
ncbi:MAG: hybrid sensor histidine kinase/response regulator [Methanobacteriota archaeon]|nr:MAG: hybrid sensor histidine kinase/response regulator [Euryarchaeota archaeon]